MLNFFKQKAGLKIYSLEIYFENGFNNRTYYGIADFRRFYDDKANPSLIALFFNKYLKLNPDKYKDSDESKIIDKYSNNRYDVEDTGMNGMWFASQRFKDFCAQEKLPFDFFPILVERERRYITMWRSLPVICDYEIDTKKTEYDEGEEPFADMNRPTFRSDFIEHYNYQIFCEPEHVFIYITDSLKQKLEENNFQLSFKGPNWKTESFTVTQKKLNSQQLEQELIYARTMERKLYLTKKRYNWFQEVDDYLEKTLIAEKDQKGLAKFRTEMKGVWQKDFARYEQGLMQPLERITYW